MSKKRTLEEVYKEMLSEAFSNYTHRLSKDKKEQLFDFYMLVGLQKPSNPKLRAAYEESLKVITRDLRKELLNAVMFAVSAEFRHIFSANSARSIKAFFDKYGAKNFIKDYATKYKMMSMGMGEFTDRDRKDLARRFKNDNRGYQESYSALKYAMKRNSISSVEFMEMAADAFDNMDWYKDYGGYLWAAICRGWLRLEDAGDDIDKLVIAIDHVYDLQHNTDTVFNKLKSYYKGGYEWVEEALDKKKYLKNVYEIYDDVSAGLKSFAAAIIKDTTGQSLEMWLNKQSQSNGVFNSDYIKSAQKKSVDTVGKNKKPAESNGKMSFESGLTPKSEFNHLSSYQISELRDIYDAIKDNSISYINLSALGLKLLPKWLKGITVDGNVIITNNKLKDLTNSPAIINGRLYCTDNPLQSLKGIPYITKLGVTLPYNFTEEDIEAAQEESKEEYTGKSKSNGLISFTDGLSPMSYFSHLEQEELDILKDVYDRIESKTIDSIDLSRLRLKRFPKWLSGVVVDGDFNCNENSLISLEGAPQEVGGIFTCNQNELTSLKGAPQSVGAFACNENNLISLEGAPQMVGGDFYCYENELRSLKGSPKIVGGDFYCYSNQLKSLVGAPQKVGGDFYCTDNKLTSLDGAPQMVVGNFVVSGNPVNFTYEDIAEAQEQSRLKNKISFKEYFELKTKNILMEVPIPPEWDQDVYTDRTSFAKQVKYAMERAAKLGTGSSRVVFNIPFEGRQTALKIAKNKKGLDQNSREADYGLYRMYPNITVPLIDYDETNEYPRWIHTEKAEKMTKAKFKKLTGFSFDHFGSLLRANEEDRNGRRRGGFRTNYRYGIPQDVQDQIEDSEIFYNVTDLMGNFDILAGDLGRTANWGIYQGRPVIIDLGFNSDVMKKHYSK